jgi:enoyl-CoA hydratase
MEALECRSAVRFIILTGDERALLPRISRRWPTSRLPDILQANHAGILEAVAQPRQTLDRAVAGFALRRRLRLGLQCDLIVSSRDGPFAQPEIKLGIMPGAGGTQRLAKAIGPYRAMELILTGEALSAREAYERGLVNRLVPSERLLDEARQLASQIAARPPIAVRLAREAVRFGVENTLREGLEVERRNFTLLFDTHDQAEGMAAFLEKRPPNFTGE